jgi:hypothetical protein
MSIANRLSEAAWLMALARGVRGRGMERTNLITAENRRDLTGLRPRRKAQYGGRGGADVAVTVNL